MQVLIVGGGIAGLALAAALRRDDHEVEIVERAPAFGAVGAGIVLGPNALEVLRRVELRDAVIERGHAIGAAVITDTAGNTLGGTDLRAFADRHGSTVAIHRAELHEVLLSAVQGLALRPDTTLDSVESQGERVGVRLSDGSEREVDLLVGADGLRSSVREHVFGANAPRYAGYTCWRLVVEAPNDVADTREMWGRGVRFGLVRLSGDRVYCFAVANAPAGEPDPEPGRVERFRSRFAGFGGAVPAVLERIQRPDQLIHNDLEEIVQAPWQAGRVVLVGDAAHAVTPNMGQGAAMALEDTAVLAELLAEKRPLPETLAAWEQRRRPRVRFVQQQSRRIGRVAHWEGRVACALRNGVVRLTPDRVASAALSRMVERPF